MSKDSRTVNTKRNIVAGVVNRGVTIILPFINRTAIIWFLGMEFTGLSSLFTSILGVLNIAELGFNSAIVYSLYKPMAENDYETVSRFVSLFKKIYDVIGTVMLVVGLALTPFITYLIHGSYPNSINIYVIYILYLLDSVLSYYLFAYKEALLIADQRQDVADNIRTIVNIVRYVFQFLILFLTRNFYLYLITSILGTILTNLLIQKETLNRYSAYHYVSGIKKIPVTLKKQIEGLAINKIGDTFRNSLDSIIISTFLGLTMTAIYSNYYYIFAALYNLMLTVTNALSASIGNSIVKKGVKENYQDLLKFSQIFAFVLGCVTTCLAVLYQPFIKMWVGEKYLLSNSNMLLLCLYFYLICMNNIRNNYVQGNGLWWKLKYTYIAEAIGNLVLNTLLGKYFGIAGVIVATIITVFVFNYLWRNKILFDSYFKVGLSKFYKEQFWYLFVTLISVGVALVISNQIMVTGICGLIIKLVVAVVVSIIIHIIGFLPSPVSKGSYCSLINIIKTRWR